MGDADCAGSTVHGLSLARTDTGNCGCAELVLHGLLSRPVVLDSASGSTAVTAAATSTVRRSSFPPLPELLDLPCRARDDGGAGCQAPFLACDLRRRAGRERVWGLLGNRFPARSPVLPVQKCQQGDDVPPGSPRLCTTATCSSQVCCRSRAAATAGEGVCGIGRALPCELRCTGAPCPGWARCCDTGNCRQATVYDLCYQCLSHCRLPPPARVVTQGRHLRQLSRSPPPPPLLGGRLPARTPSARSTGGTPIAHVSRDACLQNCDVVHALRIEQASARSSRSSPHRPQVLLQLASRTPTDGDAGALRQLARADLHLHQLPTAP